MTACRTLPVDPFKDQIKQFLDLKLTVRAISKIINNQLPNPITYNAFKYFIQHDEILKEIKNTNLDCAPRAGQKRV